MKFPLLILIAMCLVSTAFADAPPALVVAPTGYYLIEQNAAGEPVLVKITKVVVIGDAPDPTPDPPPSTVETQVREWAAEVNHPVSAQALAKVYETVADKVASGEVAVDDAFPAVKAATDQVLAIPTLGGAERWSEWRAKLGELIVAKLQAGELLSATDMAAFLREVQAGLEGSADEAPALSPMLIELIIRLVLQILSQFFGGGGGTVPVPGPV